METKNYTIGQLAKASGVGVETIRFYELKGLIKQPKAYSGYRKYPSDDVLKIKFIKRTQKLGFTLAEAKELLNLRVSSTAKCKDVREQTKNKLSQIEKKIKDLQKMKRSLKSLIEVCNQEEKSVSECPILDHFSKDKKC